MKLFHPNYLSVLIFFTTTSIITAFSTPNSNNGQPPQPPNLVNKGNFVKSIEVLQNELAKENNQPPPPSLLDSTKFFFGLGRTSTTLSIEQIQNGLTLVEANNLVLVNGVSQDVYDAGLHPQDTIVKVSILQGEKGSGYSQDCKEMDIEHTAEVIRGAIQYVMEQNDVGDEDAIVEFEVNRLMKLGYADDQ